MSMKKGVGTAFAVPTNERRLAAATTTAVAIIDKQEDNDDKQQPGAINTVKQVPQTHVFPPPSSLHTMKIDAIG